MLTRDSALEFLAEVTVAPLTRTVRDIPTEVERALWFAVGFGAPH